MADQTTTTTAAPGPPQESPASVATGQRQITPPVDIYETAEELVLMADIPGVASEDLEIHVDRNQLTIRGHSRQAASDGAASREYELGDYCRQFELSDTVNLDEITAELKHGVLLLHVPKAPAAKPRRIAVQVN